MARRPSKSVRESAGRDLLGIANLRLPRPIALLPRSGRTLQDIEDRRTYHPGPVRNARTRRQWAHVLVVTRKPVVPKGRPALSSRVAFANPREVLVCVRRKRRKEVLHAKGVAGRKGIKRYRRNEYSEVSCR